MLRLISLFYLSFCIGLPVLATETEATLFHITVPQKGGLLEAEKQALSLVLTRLSGGQVDLTQAGIVSGLDKVGALIKDVQTTNEGLDISFDPDGVKALLHSNNQPVWLAPRPPLLFWLVDSQLPIPMVPGDTTTAWPKLFAQAGTRVGLPTRFPLMDLDDIGLASPDAIEQGLMTPLLKASQRYGQGLLVLGTLTHPSDDQWQLVWQLREGKGKGESLIQGQASGDQNKLVADTMAAISHYLASRYADKTPEQEPSKAPLQPVASAAELQTVATAAGAADTLQVVVDHVSSLDDLLALQALFRNMPTLAHSNVVSMDGDRVVFALKLHTDANAFFEALKAEKHLTPADATNRLHWQWQTQP